MLSYFLKFLSCKDCKYFFLLQELPSALRGHTTVAWMLTAVILWTDTTALVIRDIMEMGLFVNKVSWYKNYKNYITSWCPYRLQIKVRRGGLHSVVFWRSFAGFSQWYWEQILTGIQDLRIIMKERSTIQWVFHGHIAWTHDTTHQPLCREQMKNKLWITQHSAVFVFDKVGRYKFSISCKYSALDI